jgi:peptidoglycan/xylan/chitin deacetylase (PgdA/CDA1 family)
VFRWVLAVSVRAISLGYHDVVEEGMTPESVRRPSAAHYSISRSRFRQHLELIQRVEPRVSKVTDWPWATPSPLFFTFDDGGTGADTCVADELERSGWRGHFFITTDWIGCPGFIDAARIRDLNKRGHVIGSHTRSHPSRMSRLSWEKLISEWTQSRNVLADIVGVPITAASVADGYYSRRVGRAAAACGLKFLFNSEPTQTARDIGGCLILGRYAILGDTTATHAAALARGQLHACLRQTASWQSKKIVKTLAGETYLTLRRAFLSRGRPQNN